MLLDKRLTCSCACTVTLCGRRREDGSAYLTCMGEASGPLMNRVSSCRQHAELSIDGNKVRLPGDDPAG